MKLNPKRSWQHQQSLPSQRRADATTRLAIEWLRRVEAPFFLWLHYFDPHDPRLVPPKEFLAQFDLSTPPPPGRAGNRLAYEPEISFMDQQIGVVLNHLSSRGVYENTLVVALADHGQGLGDHGWFYHRLLYQEQIHIPLIVKLPKSVAPMPKRLDAIVRSVDVFPTVLDVLGLPISTELDGRSLMPLIRGRADSPRSGLAEALNTLDTAVPPGLPDKHRDLLFALVEDRWKAIYHAGSPNASELYDLRVDPQELANVASKHPDVLQSMIAQIESTGATSMAFSKSDEVDAEHIEQLKALGYVEE